MSMGQTASGTDEGNSSRSFLSPITRLFECIIPNDVIALLARIVVGLVFWNSGQTKVEGFEIKSKTFALFKDIYNVPLIPPDVAAYMATIAEHAFPVLLWLGLLTRFGAAGLLFMALVIQAFVFPEAYLTHGLWAIALLFLMVNGAGIISLDHLLFGANESGARRTDTAGLVLTGLFALFVLLFIVWINGYGNPPSLKGVFN